MLSDDSVQEIMGKKTIKWVPSNRIIPMLICNGCYWKVELCSLIETKWLFYFQVIGRMCKIIDKTCLSPTPTLEQHLMWDDIAILARYMLMLSFNNSLDVAAHLPYLFHVVTLLVATGPLSLRASTHGLVINIIHSLCTCSQLHFSGKFLSDFGLSWLLLSLFQKYLSCLPLF